MDEPREAGRREGPEQTDPSRERNVFVVGHDAYHEDLLQRLAERERLAFHPLLETRLLRDVDELPVERLLEQAGARLRAFPGPVDAIVTFLDFPALEITSILAARYGTRAPSLSAVLRCNHKYWSRMLQQRVAREHVPAFAAFDPWHETPLSEGPLPLPFWIKPFNGYRSHLGFRIRDARDLAAALPRLREELPRIADPFARLMDRVGCPPELEGIASRHCLAEAIVSGRQCTLEGYVLGGEVHVYGVVDSIRAPNRSSFARYQYPSTLPERVTRTMTDVIRRVVAAVELRDGPFNAEFFFDRRRERIWLLEINPRISQSHCELFEKVDGQSHQKVALDIALGRTPRLVRGEGPHRVAAKFFLRAYRDARVRRVPGAGERARLAEDVPGATLTVLVEEGERLSELRDQDSYSYELGWLWIGARDQRTLLEAHRRAVEILDFQLEPIGPHPVPDPLQRDPASPNGSGGRSRGFSYP